MRHRAGQKGAAARQKPTGIREIAESLGVSIGTVDRALHDRPGINQKTRTRILEQAKAMGYRPNLAARFLSSRKQLKVGVNLPAEIASFFDLVRDGVLEAVGGVETSDVKLVHRSYPGLGNGEKEALAEALESDLDGLIMVPGQPECLVPLLRKAAERRLPVVCVNSDAPQVEHLATVCVDSLTTGALAGELMGRFIASKGPLVAVTGQLSTIDHAQKVAGFRQAVAEMWPELRIGTVVEAHDHEPEAYEKCRKLLRGTSDIAGIYVTTANSIPVMRAVEEAGLGGRLTVITSDLFPALAKLIESGRVAATLYQRPVMQGQLAFRALYSYLVEGVQPAPVTRLAPHVVMKSNLKLFLDRLPRPAGGSRRRKLDEGEPMSREDVTA
jgi:LacI family transcriptional regulator